MRVLFTLTIFVGSALLFLVQPMIAKIILPVFGGSPEVWNTSMVFFQAVLLLGYGYAHLSTRFLGVRRQAMLHLVVLLVPLLVLPIALPQGYVPSGSANPTPLVLGLLAMMVGLPFFVVSAGSSILQRWFAHTGDKDAGDPYFLYAASNLGSMVALLGYPFLMEPRLRLAEQSSFWSTGYFVLVALTALCAVALWRSREPVAQTAEEPDDEVLTWRRKLKWVALAFVPSSLLLGVTTFLTTNLAAVPLLWVVPLSLYLITFVAAFAKKRFYSLKVVSRLLALVAVPLMIVVILESSEPDLIWALIAIHLGFFLLAGLMCHGELSDDRPKPRHLTEFYFWIAFGGVLGGAFNALLSPVLFDSLAEYPIAIVLACLLRPRTEPLFNLKRPDFLYPIAIGAITISIIFAVRMGWVPFARQLGPGTIAMMVGIPALLCFLAIDRVVRYGLSLAIVFYVSNQFATSADGKILLMERSFFGVHRVVSVDAANGTYHRLVHGNTIHGMEAFSGPVQGQPLTYYSPSSPVGTVFQHFSGDQKKEEVALVGLGVGSLAAYGEPGQRMTYFEIDPTVLQIAENPELFTFLERSQADIRVVLGDARLSLARESNGKYGLIVLDAFSSDAIPIHLLTIEAMRMYFDKLSPDGVIAVHVSNRYLDLEPVLAEAAKALGVSAMHYDDVGLTEEERMVAKFASRWVLMARRREDFAGLAKIPGWTPIEAQEGTPLWTDDFSNLVSALKADE